MNKDYIQQIVGKYQAIFRLMDWDIVINIAHNKKPVCFAETDCDVMTRKATITFFQYCTGFNKLAGLDEVVKHELAHILNGEVHAFICALKIQNKINEIDWQMYTYYNERYASSFERMKL